MKTLTKEELMIILNDHQKWLAGTGGVRADLSNAGLSGANLSGANLSGANLSGADLSGADLSDAGLSGANLSRASLFGANLSRAILFGANLSRAILFGANLFGANLFGANLFGANLFGANLFGANLSRADLRGANLIRADLRGADLSNANLSNANLSNAYLSNTNLSNVEGLLNPIEYLEKNFEKTNEGIIVYKSFGEHYAPNPNWEIAEGSIIEDVVDPLPTVECGSGINVATKEWAKRECYNQIWKCLIRWEWLAGVVVPYQTEGQIRASRVQLIKPVNCL